jgi:hypothetical protein
MAKSQVVKQHTQMSGEFGVVSELFRRHIQATITYGNSKSADVFVISESGARAAKIEVKTSVLKKWIVGLQAKNPLPHVVWVFVHMPKAKDTVSRAEVAEMGASSPSYHVLTSAEVKKLYQEKVAETLQKAGATVKAHPIVFTFADLQFYQNQWHKVLAALQATKA